MIFRLVDNSKVDMDMQNNGFPEMQNHHRSVVMQHPKYDVSKLVFSSPRQQSKQKTIYAACSYTNHHITIILRKYLKVSILPSGQ